MTRQAADWSEHDLDRRFALGPARDELTQLASTLDGLLERLAASLRHEQRLSAEISHELRTPLASIVAEAQYALRHGRQTDESRATLEHILQSAQAARPHTRHADGGRPRAARPAAARPATRAPAPRQRSPRSTEKRSRQQVRAPAPSR